MIKRFLAVALVLVVAVNLFFTSSTLRRNNYIADLVEEINLLTISDGDDDDALVPIISPMVKEDRKDDDQFNILTIYRNKNDDLISKVLILPDGIEEPFQMSVIIFNITETEQLFIEKNGKGSLPKKLNNHKLMKPCKGEVEIPVLQEIGFRVENISTITQINEKYKYHNMGYCTKADDMSNRYLEIDGKSSEKEKFKFEFGLQIMGFLYPGKYSTSTIQTITGWKFFKHFVFIVMFVCLALGGHYFYSTKVKGQIFNKLNDEIELRRLDKNRANRTDADHDIDQFIIEDEDDDVEAQAQDSIAGKNKKKNKKVSFKNAQEDEVEDLLRDNA